MMNLIIPNDKYYNSYVEAIDEYKKNSIDTYSFFDAAEHDIFVKFEDSRLGRNLPENYVPGTYLWLVNEEDFLGEICIRHKLNDALLHFGGNIGYGIRYSEWNKGLGTIMLTKGLLFAKEEIGLNRVLITCNDNNIASARVIEKNGGILQDVIINIIDGAERKTKRYWIDII